MSKKPKIRRYNNLKAEIIRKGLSLTETAKLIGMSRISFYNRMKGSSKFSFDEAKKLADLLSVDIEFIMEYQED